MADPTPAQQSIIIWVATTGSDTTGTGSQSAPYRTIEKAVEVFQAGNQIRILDGTYTPIDSIIISGISGSIFAENPGSVYIQPEKTRAHQACLAILNAERFTLTGLTVLQAADTTGNQIGIYAENISNLIAYTCTVTNFESPSGDVHGFYASGFGRLERCDAKNLSCAGSNIWGIKTVGVDVIDCEVIALSGASNCNVYGIEYDGVGD